MRYFILCFPLVCLLHFVTVAQSDRVVSPADSSLVIADSIQSISSELPTYRHSISTGFRYEKYFRGYNNRTFFYAQYGRHFRRIDWFIKALQYTLGDSKGYQFESELYQKFKKSGYLYVDAAYSEAAILPQYRLRTEVFLSAGHIEYSFGAGMVKPFHYNLIPVVTGTVGYYFGDYFVYARPTFTYVEGGFTKSLFLQARRYFTKASFISLSMLGGADAGTSRSITSIANSFGNNTYLVRLQAQLARGPYKLGAGIDYGGIYIPVRSEYAPFFGIDLSINRSF